MLSGVETSELLWQIVEDGIRRLKEEGGHAGVDITRYSHKTHQKIVLHGKMQGAHYLTRPSGMHWWEGHWHHSKVQCWPPLQSRTNSRKRCYKLSSLITL